MICLMINYLYLNYLVLACEQKILINAHFNDWLLTSTASYTSKDFEAIHWFKSGLYAGPLQVLSSTLGETTFKLFLGPSITPCSTWYLALLKEKQQGAAIAAATSSPKGYYPISSPKAEFGNMRLMLLLWVLTAIFICLLHIWRRKEALNPTITTWPN